ncbi:MAG: cytochrome c [Myxococcales bacterium]|nr:cytochrome c [Myxococcales bacterium]
MPTLFRFSLVALTLCAACGAPQPPAEEPVAPPAAAAPAPLLPTLQDEVRTLLRPRMARHGKDLADLWGAMRADDRPAVARIARQVAEEPRLARPLGEAADDTLNATVPPAFFEFQDALAARAAALAEAAESDDGARLAPAFNALADACARCHASYFRVE